MNKKQAILIGIVALIIVLFVGLLYSFIEIETETGEDDESNKIVIIVTIAPQKEFVERVGGDKVKVAVMVPAGADLHTYEPTSSQMREVARSRIYAEVGSGVEFEIAWMEKLMSNNKDMLIVNCSNGIEKMGGDPHIWTSPVNARIMVENICDGLIRIDPDNEDYYIGNKNDYQSELDALDEYIRFKTGGFKDRVFMTYHPAFGYIAEEYNLEQISIEREKKEPTPKIIQECIELAKEHDLQYIFVEPQFDIRSAETIARAIGGEIAFMDPLAGDYVSNMRRIVDLLALEFGG